MENLKNKSNSNEIWKKVIGYEGIYEISSLGRVKSLERFVDVKNGKRKVHPRFLTSLINNRGYLQVKLSKNNVLKTKQPHVLIAEAFIPNPDNKKEVNHINGIKTDNRLENLEWNTHSENVKHAYDTGLIVKMGIPIIDNCSGQTFKSIKEAADFNLISYSTCKNYLNGKRKNPTCLLYMHTIEMAA